MTEDEDGGGERGKGLTVVESVGVVQAAKLVKACVHHPCPVAGHRQSLRLAFVGHETHSFLIPGKERQQGTRSHGARVAWEMSSGRQQPAVEL